MRKNSRKYDLNKVLKIEILEAGCAISRILTWEAVKGRLLQQEQVNVVI